jgi:ribosome biogenesis protein ENP2
VQDLEFPTASQCIQMTPDNRFMVATGTYQPQVRIYENAQLSMKCSRHLTSEVIAFQVLSDDYRKLAFLQTDRIVELHASYGSHFKTRVPREGRDMLYDRESCDLVIGGSSNEVWRLNLEQGRFMEPLRTGSPGINVCARAPRHGLLAFGGDDGFLDCFDPRSRQRVARLDVGSIALADFTGGAGAAGGEPVAEITALRYAADGITLAAGTSTGHVLLFDLRSSVPRLVKDMRNEVPVIDIQFHPTTGLVLSTDERALKMWNANDGKIFTSIEPPCAPIKDVCIPSIEDGCGLISAWWGLFCFGCFRVFVLGKKKEEKKKKKTCIACLLGPSILTITINIIIIMNPPSPPSPSLAVFAGESARLQSYFVPTLGPAPPWCPFLDSITEELEEAPQTTVYDDYTFVTREDLEGMGLGHLVGTKLLRPYMHGFFMDAALHRRAKAVIEPFEYETYRKDKIKKAIEERRATRITARARVPKVNKELAARLASRDEGLADGSRRKRGGGPTANPMADDRFAGMFENPDFQIDPHSEDFKRLHTVARKQNDNTAITDAFEEVAYVYIDLLIFFLCFFLVLFFLSFCFCFFVFFDWDVC